MRYKYIKIMLDNVFDYGGDIIDMPDENGYIHFMEDILRIFPIHTEVKKIMGELYMQTVEHENGEIVIYGDARKYDSNWYYTFFDVDNIQDFLNGNFSFQMALECEDDDAGRDTFKTMVDVENYKIHDMYIDMEGQDIWLIRKGQKEW